MSRIDDVQLPPALPAFDESTARGGNLYCLFNVKSPQAHKRIYTADQQARLDNLMNDIRAHLLNVTERKIVAERAQHPQDKNKIEQLIEKEKMLRHCLSLLENTCTYKEFHVTESDARLLKNNFARSEGLFSASKTDALVKKAGALSIWLSSCLYHANRKMTEDQLSLSSTPPSKKNRL